MTVETQPLESMNAAVVVEAARLDLEDALAEVIEKDGLSIPPYPAVAIRLLKTVKEDKFSTDELTRILSSDQALAATVMRCANSAFYGRTRVTTLAAAIARIGAEELTRVALAAALGADAQAPGSLASLRRTVWKDSLMSAMLVRTLAPKRGLPADEAFLCGLLHDFGKIIIIGTLERILQSHPAIAAKPTQYWNDVIEKDHRDVGEKLALKWNLPDSICTAIRMHHHPIEEVDTARPFVELAMAADVVIELLAKNMHVSAEDLAKVPHLSAAEREELARIIPDLPAVIDSLEEPSDGKKATPASKVAEGESTLGDTFDVDFQVAPFGNESDYTFRAVAVSSNGFAMLGEQALPVNHLVHLQLDHDELGLEVWAKITRCQKVGTQYRVEAKPFALRGETLREWISLTTQARVQAQSR